MDKKEIVYTLVYILILTSQSVCLFYLLFTMTDNTFSLNSIPTDICILIGVAGLVTSLIFAVFSYLYLKQVTRDYKAITYIFTAINLITVTCYFIKHFIL